MTSMRSKPASYVLMGAGAVVLVLAVLLLIATYQHNAAVAAEVNETQQLITHSAEMANGSDEDSAERQRDLAEVQARADEARGSYVPAAIMLIAGVGGLLAGLRVYRGA